MGMVNPVFLSMSCTKVVHARPWSMKMVVNVENRCSLNSDSRNIMHEKVELR